MREEWGMCINEGPVRLTIMGKVKIALNEIESLSHEVAQNEVGRTKEALQRVQKISQETVTLINLAAEVAQSRLAQKLVPVGGDNDDEKPDIVQYYDGICWHDIPQGEDSSRYLARGMITRTINVRF